MKAEQEQLATTSILAKHKATALVALPLAPLDSAKDAKQEAPKFIPKLLAQARERNEEFERLRIEAQDEKVKELKDRLGITQEFITQEYQQHANSSSSSTALLPPPIPRPQLALSPTSTATAHLSLEAIEAIEAATAEHEPSWPVVDERYIKQARKRYFARLKKSAEIL